MIEIPRFSDNLALNNVVITIIATTAVLLALAIIVFVTVWFGRWIARTSGVEAVEQGMEKVWRPVRIIGSVIGLLVVLAACGMLAFSIWKGHDLHVWVNEAAAHLTWGALWLTLRVLGVLIAVVIASLYLRKAITPVLRRIEARLLNIEVLSGQTTVVQKVVASLKPLANIVLVYIAFYLGAEGMGLPDGLAWAVATTIFVVLVLNAARTVVLIVHLMTGSLDRVFLNRFEGSRFGQYYEGVRGLWPLAQRSFEAVTYLAAATLIVGEFDLLDALARFGPILINLIAIFFFARVVVELSRVIVLEAFTRAEAGTGVAAFDEARKRRNTLVYLVQSLLKYIIYFGAALAMLRELGVDPTPFLAGAGIAGMAIAFGAQKLINDMVSGFFILFEGQILKGDFVCIGDAEGIVEAVFLRVTQLRDNRGRLHTIRNGQIERVINYSREYVMAVVDVGVAYESDLNAVFKVIDEAGAALKEEHPHLVLQPPRVLGVNSFEDSAIVIRIATKVVPGNHLVIERAVRKLLKEHFNRSGVEIPYPRRVMLTPEAKS